MDNNDEIPPTFFYGPNQEKRADHQEHYPVQENQNNFGSNISTSYVVRGPVALNGAQVAPSSETLPSLVDSDAAAPSLAQGGQQGILAGRSSIQTRGPITPQERNNPDYAQRFLSYMYWAVDKPHPRLMAEANFEFIEYSALQQNIISRELWKDQKRIGAQIDTVICYSCNKTMLDWASDDIPMEQHKKWFPWCPFIQSQRE